MAGFCIVPLGTSKQCSVIYKYPTWGFTFLGPPTLLLAGTAGGKSFH